ncbi:SRPBCC family protein [Actinacidiphila acididurans]|uniref:SRPBCC family protein n=1 Tax=Actinacidiphila acididurans TaxID=2784346 RepID=A0ABS2U445_9ACTN|nr:SRPBCC family protein [Actinacidiphila acididurans]MBM9509516.1 SRPBCC family protein [Actinacidiphila acididurans]
MPSVSANVFVPRTTAEVFDFLADARNLALWSSGVASVDPAYVAPGADARYRYRFPGRHRTHQLVCSDFQPCRRIAFRGQRMWGPLGSQVPVYGFDLFPHADGTLVRLSVNSRLTAALALLAPVVAMAWRRDLPTDGSKFCELLGGVLPAATATVTAVQPAALAPAPAALAPAAATPSPSPVQSAAAAPGGAPVPSGVPNGFDYAH